MEHEIKNMFDTWNKNTHFSGVFSVSDLSGIIFQKACGYRNKAEKLPNKIDTSFAIASGTKLFTALSVCKLVDNGDLKLSDTIWDIIPLDLKNINKKVTVFHLLTHTSGIGDYIDEENISDDYDVLKLYDNHPVHKWISLDFYLPMFNELPQKFEPGEQESYCNAGFILLGLIIESISNKTYHQYVQDTIILPLGLSHTGFYKMNMLPDNTALGYIFDEVHKEYITNILYMPIIGGSDGGLFTSSGDMITLWNAILNNQIFSSTMRKQFFTSYGKFGLGVYIQKEEDKTVYYTVGKDFGVSFFSAYYPKKDITVSLLSNTEINTSWLFTNVCNLFGK
jgi:CubicO group peptidase (beta-lactamase class C family)